MKIGIFGGSFNPPHKMHEKMALELLNKGYLDKIIYVPTGSKYEYKNNLISNEDRYNMLKIMIGNDIRFDVSSFELKDYVVYTCDSLEYFTNLYKDDTIYFICGADNLSYIDKWKNGLDILKKYKIITVKRKGEDTEFLLEKFKKYKNNIIISDVTPNDLSSTFIRDLIKNRKNSSKYLNKNVLKYIESRKLYEN